MVDKEKLASIYNRYVDDMHSYALYLGFNENDIMDAIHDVFYHLFEKDKRINEISNMKYYLLKSLRNRLIDIAKKNRKEISFSNTVQDENTFAGPDNTVEKQFISEEEEKMVKSKIDGMLKMLSARQKEILYLRYIHEYDYSQISGLMNMDYSNCRKLVYKAIQTLRDKYSLPLVCIILSGCN